MNAFKNFLLNDNETRDNKSLEKKKNLEQNLKFRNFDK